VAPAPPIAVIESSTSALQRTADDQPREGSTGTDPERSTVLRIGVPKSRPSAERVDGGAMPRMLAGTELKLLRREPTSSARPCGHKNAELMNSPEGGRVRGPKEEECVYSA